MPRPISAFLSAILVTALALSACSSDSIEVSLPSADDPTPAQPNTPAPVAEPTEASQDQASQDQASQDQAVEDQAAEEHDGAELDEIDETQESDEPGPDEPESLSPPAPPAIAPGGLATGSVEIGDTTIEYVTVVPEGFEIGDTAPLMLAFPPGGQDYSLTQAIVQGTYQLQALERGWVVVSPAAPGGTLFFRGAERHVPGFVDWIEGWVTPEGGAPHVVGVSNGGLSAFRYAGNNPERVASIVAFPGFPGARRDVEALGDLTDIPIRMFVGANDTPWVASMEEAAAQLQELDGDVKLQIFPDEGHIIGALSDGTQIFDTLDELRP